MKDTIWLIRKTAITTFKNYKNWLLYIALPILAIVLAILTRSGSGEMQVNIGVINDDRDQVITLDAIDFINGMESVLLSEIKESEINDNVITGKLDAVLIFPEGFAESILNGQPDYVEIVSIKGAEITGFVKTNLNQYLDNIAYIANTTQSNHEIFNTMYTDFQNLSFNINVEKVEDRKDNHVKSIQLIGYLVVIMMFSASNLSQILIKERENRTFYRIIFSPIKAKTYVFSNIIVNLGVLIVQIVLTLVVMIEIFQVNPYIPYWIMFLILGLFSLVSISLSLAIVAFSKNSMGAMALQNMFFIPTSILAGCMFPIEMMPAVMQKIAYFFPQYWVLDAFQKMQQQNALTDIYVNLLILVSFAITLSLITIYKLKRNNDTRSYI